ncbi:class II fumarate hydratase [Planctobacterium marinum]|uniref:class II fumarate hydratase n=1 Tax=Planctobacterium marinum TaxID=1631968 RepID=UPI001E292432|nr:class II fumarate hydratase [Planctobacterium marinum]MCC2608206.1 class II fumarate hydratase [Planctobacterium marinum]
MSGKRIEKDSMGQLEVPADALYGAQTQRAINNFPVSGCRMPEPFIKALLLVKQVAAEANGRLGGLTEKQAEAIQKACLSLLAQADLMSHFPVDVFQTGSGTSSNMNANEVIARVASADSELAIHPNDHVNYGQSSNDVIPTTIHVSAALEINNQLLPALLHLRRILKSKAEEVGHHCKTGRTHLMDAMPVTMGQVLTGWTNQVEQQLRNLEAVLPSLHKLAQGGTAVGTGINAHPEFAKTFCQLLETKTDVAFKTVGNFFPLISSQDTVVTISGVLKSIAVTLMKFANDLRWMNSGPLAGLGEIALPALQPGSSIMPGKVNPVVPESVAMACAQVIGNDTAITVGGQSGNFELNVMLPMIASNLLQNIQLLSNSAVLLADKAIEGFTINEDNLNHALDRNPILVTALNSIIGYNKAAEIAKKAYAQGRPVVDVAAEETDFSVTELQEMLSPKKLTKGG